MHSELEINLTEMPIGRPCQGLEYSEREHLQSEALVIG